MCTRRRALHPDRVGEFRRVKVYQYDREGRDVSVGYNLESSGRQIAVTAYVHPAGRTFEEDVASMREAHASYQLVFDRAVEVSRVRHNLNCRLARVSYEEQFAHRFGPVDSYLLVCIDGSWRLKWRLSQRTAHEYDASDLLLETAGATAVRE